MSAAYKETSKIYILGFSALNTFIEQNFVEKSEGTTSACRSPEAPELLFLAIGCFSFVSENTEDVSLLQMKLRSYLALQRAMPEQEDALKETTLALIKQIENTGCRWPYHAIEHAGVFRQYNMEEESERCLKEATSLSGIHFSFSGTSEKRTEWQEHPTPKLVLIVEHTSQKEAETLSDIHFAVLSGFVSQMVAFYPQDSATAEYIAAFSSLILRECSSHEILRHIAEVEAAVTDDRIKKEKLAELVSFLDTTPEKTNLFFCLDVRPRWEQVEKKGLALEKNGDYRSALELYTKNNMEREVAVCLLHLGEKEKAKEMFLRQLAGKEDPETWCNLAAATDNIEHYRMAVSVSKGKSERALNCLMRMAFHAGNYEEAIENCLLCIDQTPQSEKALFFLGCCYMKTEAWEKALSAFRKVASTSDECFEAWNNIAAIHLSCNDKKSALDAFRKAASFSYDTWQIWDNILTLSMALDDVLGGLIAFERVLEIRGNKTDFSVLVRILQTAYSKDMMGALEKKKELQILSALSEQNTKTAAAVSCGFWLAVFRVVKKAGSETTSFPLLSQTLTASRRAPGSIEEAHEYFECRKILSETYSIANEEERGILAQCFSAMLSACAEYCHVEEYSLLKTQIDCVVRLAA
ncbi:MAG: TPR repeat protein, TTC27 family [Amphiamblys sp. WSBS2006]|nr:MAG: TPR repeat protein, TTC27 family [Amphiamblys sp. WSBS2006]